MKKKSFIVIVILLVAIIIGLCVFIAYDKNLFGIKGEKKESSNAVEKKEDTNTTKEVDINSDLVKNLVYPHNNPGLTGGYFYNFELKNQSVTDYSRDDLIVASFNWNNQNPEYLICDVDDEGNVTLYDDIINHSRCIKYSEEDIKSELYSVFGPDTNYESKTLSMDFCGAPKYYDEKTKSYYTVMACGGVPGTISSVRKTYKAELNGEYLNIYDYALISFAHDSIDGTLLFNDYDSFSKYYPTMEVTTGDYVVNNESEAQSKLEELINSGKANTYIWTFKKQSDGKYYYYSSKWQ